MKLIKTEEFTKDGITYIREIYDNGTTVEYVKPDDTPQPTPEPEPDPQKVFQDTVLTALADLYELVLGE